VTSCPDPDALDALYAKIPNVECRGLCAHTCNTAIDMSSTERRRIAGRGVDIPPPHQRALDETCPALTFLKTCGVHPIRPTVCRLWGASESMRCPYGCPVDGDVLTDMDAMNIMLESYLIGGHDDLTAAMVRRMLAWWQSDPEVSPLVSRVMQGDLTAPAAVDELLARRRAREPGPR
jgi:hypothetical protein